jgi:DNA-directed RNA polymerase subunit RPC12/RpoP
MMTEDKDVRIIALKCPNCGGELRVPEGTDKALCEHCRSTVLVLNAQPDGALAGTGTTGVPLSEAAKKRVLKIVLWTTAITAGLPILTTVLIFIILAVVFLVLGLGLIGSGR